MLNSLTVGDRNFSHCYHVAQLQMIEIPSRHMYGITDKYVYH